MLLVLNVLSAVSSNLVEFGKPEFMHATKGGCDAKTTRDTLSTGEVVGPAVEYLTKVDKCGSPPAQDCQYCLLTSPDSTSCAKWESEESNPKGVKWPLYLSYVIGAAMAYAIGGNDSANSLATTVGSGAMGLRNACIMGAIGEFIGATLLGAGVSSTIQRGVADINDPTCWACGFCNSMMPQYQLGMLAALFGAAFFLLLVTFWSLPVSTTHAVVGGVVGMTMAAVGTGCLNWSFESGLGRIAAGWVVSPVVSGAIGSVMYMGTYYFIMKSKDPKRASLLSVPIMYGATFAMMTYLTLMKAPLTKNLVSSDQNLIISFSMFFLVGIIAQIVVVPQMRALVDEEEQKLNEAGGQSTGSFFQDPKETLRRMSSVATKRSMVRSFYAEEESQAEIKPAEVELTNGAAGDASNQEGLVIFTQSPPNVAQIVAKKVFKNLLVMTAFIKCVGHGANDTANATGIVGAVQFLYEDGIHACGSKPTDTMIMAIAGAFVGVGVITMGYRVIQAVGQDLADIDFHVGFCVEFASACAVVVATILGLPVSTTHCQIGAIIFVAATAYGNEGVAWSMFGKIAVTWVATLPAAGGVAYILTWLRLG